MRPLPLLILGLFACSDYDLGQKGGEPGARDPRDSGAPDTDQDTLEDTDPGTETGGGTIPDDTDDTDIPVEVPDGRIDVVLIIDEAYVYDCYHAEIGPRSYEVASALIGSGANVAVAIASYDDYQVSGEWYAASDGVPYRLEQQLTTDLTLLQAASNGLELEWGGDGPGSGLEALIQVADGDGYDQDCDGTYDRATDIKPFNARSSDAFGGSATGSADTSTPGTGTRSGVGWRDGSKRVVVLLAENTLRDRAESHDFPSGSCTATQGRTAVASALTAIDAKFLGVNAYEFQDIDTALQEQLVDLARSTSSKIDADGDGAVDDDAVLYGSWDWPSTGVLVQAIWDVAG